MTTLEAQYAKSSSMEIQLQRQDWNEWAIRRFSIIVSPGDYFNPTPLEWYRCTSFFREDQLKQKLKALYPQLIFDKPARRALSQVVHTLNIRLVGIGTELHLGAVQSSVHRLHVATDGGRGSRLTRCTNQHFENWHARARRVPTRCSCRKANLPCTQSCRYNQSDCIAAKYSKKLMYLCLRYCFPNCCLIC